MSRRYYVYLEGGIGDIINNHKDPTSGIGYAAAAKEQGHHISCLINSPWSGAVRSLLELNPCLDEYVLLPPSGPVLQADLSHKVEIAREQCGTLMDQECNILVDRDRFEYRPAPIYLSTCDTRIPALIQSRHIAIQTKTVGASAGCEKEWPDASWEELLWALQEMVPNHRLVLLGTEETRRPIRHPPAVLDLTGRTTIREAIAVLLGTDAFIGIDSFLRCAAYHMGAPSVILYEPPRAGAEEHFRGYFKGVDAPQHRVVRGRAIADIEVAQVSEALREVVGYTDSPRNDVTLLGDSGDLVARRAAEH